MRIARIASLLGALALIGTYYVSAQPTKASPTFTVRAYKSNGQLQNVSIRLEVKDADCRPVTLNYSGTSAAFIDSSNGKFPATSPNTFTVTLPSPAINDKSLRIYMTKAGGGCVEVRAVHGDSGSNQAIAIVVP